MYYAFYRERGLPSKHLLQSMCSLFLTSSNISYTSAAGRLAAALGGVPPAGGAQHGVQAGPAPRQVSCDWWRAGHVTSCSPLIGPGQGAVPGAAAPRRGRPQDPRPPRRLAGGHRHCRRQDQCPARGEADHFIQSTPFTKLNVSDLSCQSQLWTFSFIRS